MSRWVVDASVAVKWFLPEVQSAEAVRLLRDDYLLFAPDLIWAEFGNVLWKKWRQREIEADVARQILEDFRRFPIEVRSSDTLLATAWTIAEELHRTMYDILYLALAESQGYRLVTADHKFYNSLKDSRLGTILVRVEDLPFMSSSPSPKPGTVGHH